jgi:hypothetical protein
MCRRCCFHSATRLFPCSSFPFLGAALALLTATTAAAAVVAAAGRLIGIQVPLQQQRLVQLVKGQASLQPVQHGRQCRLLLLLLLVLPLLLCQLPCLLHRLPPRRGRSKAALLGCRPLLQLL